MLMKFYMGQKDGFEMPMPDEDDSPEIVWLTDDDAERIIQARMDAGDPVPAEDLPDLANLPYVLAEETWNELDEKVCKYEFCPDLVESMNSDN